jgi:hypothetical protein
MDLLKEFVPKNPEDFAPKPLPKGFIPNPPLLRWQSHSLKRLVRRYRNHASVTDVVKFLEAKFLPTTLRQFDVH